VQSVPTAVETRFAREAWEDRIAADLGPRSCCLGQLKAALTSEAWRVWSVYLVSIKSPQRRSLSAFLLPCDRSEYLTIARLKSPNHGLRGSALSIGAMSPNIDKEAEHLRHKARKELLNILESVSRGATFDGEDGKC
jgi:hypothetical protein